MKGQSLKEALEYIPAQPKKKFATLSSEDRVKRLRQELADMEKLMRTGIGPSSSSLASGIADFKTVNSSRNFTSLLVIF